MPQQFEEVLQCLPPELSEAPELPEPEDGLSTYLPPIIERTGATWMVHYKGRTVSIKNSSGIPYLLHLLRYPYQEFHVLTLTAVCRGQVEGPRQGSTGDQLDAQAIASYKKRLLELEEEKAQLLVFHDLGKLESLEDEMEALKAELRSALGLSGRRRQTGRDSERARKTISKAISRVLIPLHESHPGLSRHLQRSVRLGTSMSYLPGKPVQWRCVG